MANQTGQLIEGIEKDTDRDAYDVVEYGLIDAVLTSE
jgi:ATP-dependent protease ClpP protease subunit